MKVSEHGPFVRRYLHGTGVEIGAYKTPIPGITPIHVDRFDHYAGAPTGAEFFGDACDLPMLDSSLDFVATSHVIEHVADPVAAFNEWCRVLKDKGVIYMVVPDRRLTFDHTRALTPIDHMLQDHRIGTTPVDGTHIDDFVFGLDWERFSPDTAPDLISAAREELAKEYRTAISEGREINIHFHTFEPQQMVALINAVNDLPGRTARMKVLEVVEPFSRSRPDGFLIVARIVKPGAPVSKRSFWWKSRNDQRSVLKENARRF